MRGIGTPLQVAHRTQPEDSPTWNESVGEKLALTPDPHRNNSVEEKIALTPDPHRNNSVEEKIALTPCPLPQEREKHRQSLSAFTVW